MSNNDYDLTDNSVKLASLNTNNVLGFITQKRIKCNDLICMTPGVSTIKSQVDDQKYRDIKEIVTAYIIVWRSL